MNRFTRVSRRTFLTAVGAAVGGCRGEKKRLIGVIAEGRTHLFWQTVHAGAVAASRERGVEIQWNAPASESDLTGQIQMVDAMINRRVDAIALCPGDVNAMVAVVERAVAQKIPVIIFDTGIATESYSSWVATDNYAGGQMGAERMAEILNGRGKVAVVAVRPGAASSVAREAGFEETINARFPKIEIVDKRFGNADFAQSLAVSENILTAHPGLDGIFASNESSSVGAMQALKSRKGTRAKMVGFDWSPNLIEELQSGLIDSLVVQNPFKIGYESVIAAADVLEGKPVKKINKLPARLIRKEDLEKQDVKALIHPDLKRWLG